MKLNNLSIKNVIQYGYRTARVIPVITINRNDILGIELENQLLAKANANSDNHVCFDIEQKNGDHLYVMCTDSSIYIGTQLIPGVW